jgi:hypothetical protein
MGRDGASACTILLQASQAIFGRTCWITFQCSGTYSSISARHFQFLDQQLELLDLVCQLLRGSSKLHTAQSRQLQLELLDVELTVANRLAQLGQLDLLGSELGALRQ